MSMETGPKEGRYSKNEWTVTQRRLTGEAKNKTDVW